MKPNAFEFGNKPAIIEVLIRRDNMSPEAAEDYFNEGMTEVMECIDSGDGDPEEVFQDYFGLEPDYLF